MGRTLALFLCLGSFVASFSRGALAADTDELIRRGIELRRSAKDAEALAVFQQAYEQSQAPKALVQIGFAEQALGKWGAADRHLRAAVQSSADTWIAKHRQVIEDALTTVAKHVGRLDVRGGPPGAEVRVDGAVIGQLPLAAPFSVTADGIAIEVRAPGYVSITRSSVVPVGTLVRETFDLQPVASASATPSPAATVVPVTAPAAMSASEPAPRHEPPSLGGSTAKSASAAPSDAPAISARSVVALGATGLAAAALTLAVVEHISWQNKANQFGQTTGCDPAAVHRGSAACESLYNDGQRARLFAIGGYSLGAGLLVTAAVLFLTAPTADSNPPRQVACAVNPLALGGGCAVRF